MAPCGAMRMFLRASQEPLTALAALSHVTYNGEEGQSDL